MKSESRLVGAQSLGAASESNSMKRRAGSLLRTEKSGRLRFQLCSTTTFPLPASLSLVAESIWVGRRSETDSSPTNITVTSPWLHKKGACNGSQMADGPRIGKSNLPSQGWMPWAGISDPPGAAAGGREFKRLCQGGCDPLSSR